MIQKFIDNKNVRKFKYLESKGPVGFFEKNLNSSLLNAGFILKIVLALTCKIIQVLSWNPITFLSSGF